MENSNDQPTTSKVRPNSTGEAPQNQITKSVQEQHLKATISLVAFFLLGGLVYGITSSMWIQELPFLQKIELLPLIVGLLKTTLTFLCTAVAILIFRWKRLAIPIAYISLGAYLIIGTINLFSIDFFGRPLSTFTNFSLLYITIHLGVTVAICYLLKNSKDVLTG